MIHYPLGFDKEPLSRRPVSVSRRISSDCPSSSIGYRTLAGTGKGRSGDFHGQVLDFFRSLGLEEATLVPFFKRGKKKSQLAQDSLLDEVFLLAVESGVIRACRQSREEVA